MTEGGACLPPSMLLPALTDRHKHAPEENLRLLSGDFPASPGVMDRLDLSEQQLQSLLPLSDGGKVDDNRGCFFFHD